jgi:hypothetical protein
MPRLPLAQEPRSGSTPRVGADPAQCRRERRALRPIRTPRTVDVTIGQPTIHPQTPTAAGDPSLRRLPVPGRSGRHPRRTTPPAGRGRGPWACALGGAQTAGSRQFGERPSEGLQEDRSRCVRPGGPGKHRGGKAGWASSGAPGNSSRAAGWGLQGPSGRLTPGASRRSSKPRVVRCPEAPIRKFGSQKTVASSWQNAPC